MPGDVQRAKDELAGADPNDLATTIARIVLTTLTEVMEMHAQRIRNYEGFTVSWCRECQQAWPCPTYELVDGKAR